MEGRQIPIIIPSYEPDEKLLLLLQKLRENKFEHIVVIDDGSGENYSSYFERAEKDYQCNVLHHTVNQGKGRALKTAFDFCLQKYRNVPGAVTADSDGQHSPECILACAEALISNPRALIMGCRCFEEKDVPARSQFGNKCTRLVMRYLTGITVSDTQTGLRGIPADFMRYLLKVKGERFEFETNMLMETKSQKIPIVEVPIQTIYIEENKTSHFNPIKDSVRIYMIFGKFMFSSLSSSVVDLVLFSVFCYLFKGMDLRGLSYLTAATIGARILSAFYNYTMNYKVVFQSDTSVADSLPKYVLLAVIQGSLSALLVNLFYPMFGGVEVLVKIPIDICLFILSFVIQREFVYRGKEK